MDQWYFNDAGQQRGPIAASEIRAKLADGTIAPDTLVWSQGMEDWKPAAEIPELQTVVAAPAPVDPRLQASPYAPPAAEAGSEVEWSGYVPSGPQTRPWVRFWARTFDYLLP